MERPRQRRRPAFSCLECRRRKIRCDRKNPCTHCVSVVAQCVYKVYRDEPRPANQQLGSTAGSPAYAPSPPDQFRQRSTAAGPSRLAGEGDGVPPRPPAAGASTTPSAPTPAEVTPRQTDTPVSAAAPTSQTEDTQRNLQDLLRRMRNLEESVAARPTSAPSEPSWELLEYRPGLLPDARVGLNKTRTLKWSHWVGMADEFDLIVAFYTGAGGTFGNFTVGSDKENSFQGGEIRSIIVRIGDLLQKCKIIAQRLKVSRPSRSLRESGFDLSLPSRDLADTMATLYCSSFESVYRILHVPSFWSEYQRYWDNPEGSTAGLRLKILLVIGIGSSLHKRGDAAEFRQMVHQWVYAAHAWLSGPLEKDRLKLSGLQVYCLVILARQIFSIGGDLVWVSMGTALNISMQMGLHRDPKHLPHMSLLQAEIRRRLWATVLEMAVQSSLDSAMPPRISLDDFDTEAPSNLNDHEMDESTTTLQPHPSSTFTSTSIQLILLGSLPTRLRILQLLSGLKSELSYQDALALSSKITDAYGAYTKFSQENSNAGVTPFHRNLLEYHVRRFLIPLHYPFSSKAQSNPLFYYSVKVSLDVAMALISPEPDEGFSRIMAMGGGLFHEGQWYAASIIGRELLSQVAAQRRDGTLQRNAPQREILKQAIRDMMSLSVARIHQGETNVKHHMFLSAMLAQTEATEAGVPCELKIVEGARDSLELCHGLLQARAGTDPLPYYDDPGYTSSSLDGLDLEFFLPDLGFS